MASSFLRGSSGKHRFARLFPLILTFFSVFAANAFAQQPSCFASASPLLVHPEGLAEPVGQITATCTGGTVGSTATVTLFLTLNTNITNRLDANSQITGITLTGATLNSVTLQSTSTLLFNNLQYTIAAGPTTFTIGGILAAIPPLVSGTTPGLVTGTLTGIGAQFTAGQTLQLGLSTPPSLLSSLVNNGVPCNGSALPATLDFPTFAATSVSSELRVTEGSPSAFAPKVAGADTGTRVLVSITGYGPGARVFVPDAIVGNSGSVATTAGAFASGVNGGMYTPGSNQLLLVRVNGADSNGAGGTLAFSKPTAATSFSTVTELTVTNGNATVAYEVVDSNPQTQESAHIPVFVVVGQTNCPSSLTPNLTAQLAPVSSVMTATMNDPIPRFVPVVPALDCHVFGDCGAGYFPNFTVATSPISLSGSSMGGPQSAFVAVGNTGAGILYFNTSVAYPNGSPTGWLSVSPNSGANNVTLQVIANPATLAQGTYTATLTVSAGSYGSGVIPVTFTVGPVGVTILNVGNAASFTYGTVAPGSYAVLYGLNMSGSNLSVTFNGLSATIVYSSATQINLIVPASLSGQQAASVIVSAGGLTSNSFRVNLAANAPGIFNPGIINVADGSVNSATHPASRGSYVSIYLTGLSNPVSTVSVSIGSLTGLVPQFAGPQPTLPALDQVNVLVPASLSATASPVPVQVCTGTLFTQTCSNQVNLYIQ